MRRALHAEWTKLRTEPGTAGLLVGTVVLTVGLSAAAAASVRCRSAGCPQDVPKLAFTGVQLGQALVAILAALAFSDEYRTGMIRTTLAAVPRRTRLLAAKAVVVAAVVAASGTIAVAGSLLVAGRILPGNGFTAEHGVAPLSLAEGPVLRAAAGSVLYLVLIALLGLGVATIVRDAATSIGLVLGLLYLFPVFAQLVTDEVWQRRLQQFGPMSAGLSIQATVDLDRLPLAPWTGLAVLGGWAAGALVAGGALLRWRDA